MPASDFQKKAIFNLTFIGSIALLLIGFPLLEGWLQEYILPRFDLRLDPEGRLQTAAGGPPDVLSSTVVDLTTNIFRILKVFLWMALVIAVVRLVTYLLFEKAFRRSTQSEISSLLKTVLSIIIYLVAFFIVFQSQYPGVQLAPLFTGSAILGIVVGLALQDTLGNLFAGIALQADQPFQVGDVVVISNRGQGIVESVSWRGVKIRTFQNKLLVISNAVLGKETIEVAPRDNLNARIVFFNTLYTDSPAKTIQVVREAVRHVENVSNKIRPVVRIRNLGDNGIDFEVKYWAEDYTKFNDTDAMIRQRIWYLFNRENLQFAYPTRTLYMVKDTESVAPEDTWDSAAEQIQSVPIFAPLSEEELELLAKASARRVYAPGEAIVRRGQHGGSMFVIARGSVKVQIPHNGGVRTINSLAVSDFFGEMSLLTGEPRTATVIADGETEVIQIKKAALAPLFEQNPELMHSICDIIEQRRELLAPHDDEVEVVKQSPSGGVLSSIRKFFGIGQ